MNLLVVYSYGALTLSLVYLCCNLLAFNDPSICHHCIAFGPFDFIWPFCFMLFDRHFPSADEGHQYLGCCLFCAMLGNNKYDFMLVVHASGN